MAYFGNIENETLDNEFFRKVIFTAEHMQLVLMTLQQDEEIGQETHEDVDQFFRVEEGEAKFLINGKEYFAKDGDAVIVPAGAKHNVINVGLGPVKLYTIYAPPNHPDKTVHKNKKEADEAEKEDN